MMIDKNNGDVLYDGIKQVREMYGETNHSIQDLNHEEIEKLRTLNSKLRNYEKVMRQETEDLFSYAQSRVNNVNDIVKDFELEIDLYFYLSMEDLAYLNDDSQSDNIMSILRTSKSNPLKWTHGYGDKNCHNTILFRQGTSIEHDKLCATFHALYDHTDLSYKEIIKMGIFEMNIKLEFHYPTMNYK